MNAQQRELLQLAILRVLLANSTRFGLGVDAVTLHVSPNFPRITARDVEPELEYLLEKGLVSQANKVLEPANRTWKLNAAGRDYLSEREE